jgi:riboflavin synthase
MFTGIIQDIGTVAAITQKGDWIITIKVHALPLANTAIGASISCSGACLTVIAKTADSFDVQASHETLDVTTLKNWHAGSRVNLEPALRMGDELGGHLVSGHVDSVTRVISRMQDGDSLRLHLAVPPSLARFLAAKGSVVIDGVSLTVNEIDDASFGVNIIPYTQSATTLGGLRTDDGVNLEIDMMARYLDRLIAKR